MSNYGCPICNSRKLNGNNCGECNHPIITKYHCVLEVEGPVGVITSEHEDLSYEQVYALGLFDEIMTDAGIHHQLAVRGKTDQDLMFYIEISTEHKIWRYKD